MNNIVKIILLFLISIQESASENQHFGTGADMKELVLISTILETPQNYLNKELTIKGAIVAVCEKRGCWMKIASDKKFQTLRIKVRDGDMVFPLSSKGKIAYATGQLSEISLPKDEAIAYLKHMADEAKEDFDPASVTPALTIYQLVPTGVTIIE